MRRVLVIGSTVLLWSATGASIGGTEEPASCASPIAPCTACHSPELARELARCIAEPWPMPASAKEVKSPLPSSDKALKFGKATYDIFCDGCHGNTGDGRGSIALKGLLRWSVAEASHGPGPALRLLAERNFRQLGRTQQSD